MRTFEATPAIGRAANLISVLEPSHMKVATVYGATHGLGLATAKQLLNSGFRVELIGRNFDLVDQLIMGDENIARMPGSSGTILSRIISKICSWKFIKNQTPFSTQPELDSLGHFLIQASSMSKIAFT